MISNQETLNLNPYMAIYDTDVPKDNMILHINELVDFSFIPNGCTIYDVGERKSAPPKIGVADGISLTSFFINILNKSYLLADFRSQRTVRKVKVQSFPDAFRGAVG